MCNNVRFYNDIYDPLTGKLYPVPCHHCEGCRIDRLALWERRASYEFIQGHAAFVTLTYDDYHLHWNKGSVYPTICDSDFVKFRDNLRYRLSLIPDEEFPELCRRNFSYVACSEYGSDRERPHLHVALFGIDFKSMYGLIQSSWQNGISDIGPIMRGGIRYILDYINQQEYGEVKNIHYFDHGRANPKMYFSRGLGKGWFLSQYDNIQQYGCAKIGNRFVPVDSYWKNKLLRFNYETLDKIRSHQDSYQKQMDRFAQSLGYACYDHYLKGARRALEYSFEKQRLKKKKPCNFISHSLPEVKYNPFATLMLDYKKKNPILDFISRF